MDEIMNAFFEYSKDPYASVSQWKEKNNKKVVGVFPMWIPEEIISNIERKYGIPGVVIDGDMIDATMVSDDQIRTRIEALLETIDARRK